MHFYQDTVSAGVVQISLSVVIHAHVHNGTIDNGVYGNIPVSHFQARKAFDEASEDNFIVVFYGHIYIVVEAAVVINRIRSAVFVVDGGQSGVSLPAHSAAFLGRRRYGRVGLKECER